MTGRTAPPIPAALQAAFDAFLIDRDPERLFAARTQYVDSLVTKAAADFLASAASHVAVAAVGGYGRRELFPYSDIDLLLLVEQESDLAALKEAISEFLRVLWDSGLRVSHSARTVAECCRLHDGNLELHISLLDLRLVWGDTGMFGALSERLPSLYKQESGAITQRLARLAQQRHAKFHNTVYHLEPNIKEGPGGIRDIHLLRWLNALLPQHGAISESLAELAPAQRFLYEVRCFLHLQNGRDNNLLSFEMQDEIARHAPAGPIAPEAWMRLYFQHARSVFQSAVRALDDIDTHNAPLLAQFRTWRSRLSTPEFTISRDRVYLRNANETLFSTESLLRLFAFVGRHGVRLAWDTQRRLKSELPKLSQLFRDTPPAWPGWRELLSQPHVALALGEMQETGLLSAAIPEWNAIDSLVVRDFYHRYTVDEHTLMAVEAVDQLMANQPVKDARFHQLALANENPATLRFAILLHDLGKGTDSSDHVRGSVTAAHEFMERTRVPQPIAQAVLFLIEHHLDLSLIMNARDLHDPATARFLTERVGTEEDLRRLVLLTYADISAVNPGAMTPWRLEQLWRVYSAGVEQLTRELVLDRIHASPAFSPDRLASPQLAAFVDGLPMRYLRTHTREQIEHHYALEQKSRREGAAVEIAREAGAYVLTVLAHDAPGLFASLCGALSSFGLNIVKAEAASNTAGCVLDLVRFTDPMRTLELNPEEVNRLEWTLQCVLRGSVAVSDLLKRRRRVSRPASDAAIAPSVRFDNEASDSATLIEFAGEDRPGLLYDLASGISACGCNLEIVMVATEAHRALDVFYVTCGGGKLEAAMLDRLGPGLVQAAAGSTS